jgi:hypothetical protein
MTLLPTTWAQVCKRAKDPTIEKAKPVKLRSCPMISKTIKLKNGKDAVRKLATGGHYLFPRDAIAGTAKCGVCGWVLERKKAVVLNMFPVGPRLRNALRSAPLRHHMRAVLRDALRSSAHTGGETKAAHDGQLYQDLLGRNQVGPGDFWKVAPVKVTNDPIEANNNKSFTPVWGTPLHIPAAEAGRPGGYYLLMVLPPGFKNLAMALEAYWKLSDNPWGDHRPVPHAPTPPPAGARKQQRRAARFVANPSLAEWSPEEGDTSDEASHRHATAEQKRTGVPTCSVCAACFNAADTRALPMGNRQTQSCKRGCCHMCWCLGFHVKGSDTKSILYLNAFARVSREKQRALMPAMQQSWGRAPEGLRAIIFAKEPPKRKTHKAIMAVGQAAEQDTRAHNNPDHASHAGYHARDPYSKFYQGWWDASECFFTCTAHEVGNLLSSVFMCVFNVGTVAFTSKRKSIEKALGRLDHLGRGAKAAWEAEEARRAEKRGVGAAASGSRAAVASAAKGSRLVEEEDESDEDATETDSARSSADDEASGSEREQMGADSEDAEEDAGLRKRRSSKRKRSSERDGPQKQSWHHKASVFPWVCSAEDKNVLRDGLAAHCKFWSTRSTATAVMVWPADLAEAVGRLKIHDWYVMSGAVGAYVLVQCRGVSEDVRGKLIAYLFAVEHLSLKRTNLRETHAQQQEFDEALADLYPLLPAHILGTIVQEQAGHWREQVWLGGLVASHATLDVESFMVFFKTLCQSRKNVTAGVARGIHEAECAYLWTLRKEWEETRAARAHATAAAAGADAAYDEDVEVDMKTSGTKHVVAHPKGTTSNTRRSHTTRSVAQTVTLTLSSARFVSCRSVTRSYHSTLTTCKHG